MTHPYTTNDYLVAARLEISHLRSEVRAFRGSSIVFAVALALSIVGHILRSAL